MRTRTPNATKIAILNAAERLFATRGFEGTSHRMITAAARVNLGAVNYHFATKDALIIAVFKRRMKPLNAERLALLTKFQEEAGKKPLPVRKILEALFRPAMDALTTPGKGGRNFLKLISLVLAEPGSYLLPVIKEEFATTAHRFQAALRLALPGSPDAEISWKLHFSIGAFVHTVAQANVLRLTSEGMCDLSCTGNALERIIDFCAGGFMVKNNSTNGRKL